MVIRDLTLRSAASFGSFHLIRLLYDEFMFYLVEQRVAKQLGRTAIAIIGLGNDSQEKDKKSGDPGEKVNDLQDSTKPPIVVRFRKQEHFKDFNIKISFTFRTPLLTTFLPKRNQSFQAIVIRNLLEPCTNDIILHAMSSYQYSDKKMFSITN